MTSVHSTDQPVEVSHNDRDGQRDGEGATNAAYGRHELARGSGGGNVSVPGAGHSDDGPVQGLGQGVEHGVRLILLQGIGHASADQHAHAHCHGQQQQLPLAVPQGVAQCLESSDVARQLEYSQDSKDPKDLKI